MDFIWKLVNILSQEAIDSGKYSDAGFDRISTAPLTERDKNEDNGHTSVTTGVIVVVVLIAIAIIVVTVVAILLFM